MRRSLARRCWVSSTTKRASESKHAVSAFRVMLLSRTRYLTPSALHYHAVYVQSTANHALPMAGFYHFFLKMELTERYSRTLFSDLLTLMFILGRLCNKYCKVDLCRWLYRPRCFHVKQFWFLFKILFDLNTNQCQSMCIRVRFACVVKATLTTIVWLVSLAEKE